MSKNTRLRLSIDCTSVLVWHIIRLNYAWDWRNTNLGNRISDGLTTLRTTGSTVSLNSTHSNCKSVFIFKILKFFTRFFDITPDKVNALGTAKSNTVWKTIAACKNCEVEADWNFFTTTKKCPGILRVRPQAKPAWVYSTWMQLWKVPALRCGICVLAVVRV